MKIPVWVKHGGAEWDTANTFLKNELTSITNCSVNCDFLSPFLPTYRFSSVSVDIFVHNISSMNNLLFSSTLEQWTQNLPSISRFLFRFARTKHNDSESRGLLQI